MNISPYFSVTLRKRFNEDMTMRKLATKNTNCVYPWRQ